ncbi:MAG: hypothetical protein RLY21_580 [Planctomycetota bacterium]|jgi:hypothetical protein
MAFLAALDPGSFWTAGTRISTEQGEKPARTLSRELAESV